MASNALSPIRTKVPRPAICASKQKIWPYTSSPWLIPPKLNLQLEYGGGSGTPPECCLFLVLTATRRPKTLDYHTTYSSINWYTTVRLQFDPVAGEWTFWLDEVSSPCAFASFVEYNIHEHLLPVRFAEFSHYFPSPTGLYLHARWTY